MRKLIQYPPSEYVPVQGKMPPQIIREFKGVNQFDPLSIPDNFFTDMQNLSTEDYPTATVRTGYTELGTTPGTKVLGIGVWKDQQLHAVFNDGTWRRWDGSAWQLVIAGLSTSAECSFANFQGNQADICLFMTNGVNGLRKWDGTTQVSFGDAPTNLNYITTYQNRLWGASGKELHACALDQPDRWQLFSGTEEDSYVKDMESTAGETINMLSGSLTKLTIGMPSSVNELYGSVPSDFNTHLITDDEGFVNNKSAATQEGIMRFMHKTGIYEYAGGTIPDKTFSDIIRKYILQISANTAAGSDGKRLYFSIPSDTILVYDPRQTVAAWSVWRGIQANCFAKMGNDLYIGDNLGRVLKIGASTTDKGTPISWSATTRPFAGASIFQKSRWIKLFITVDLDVGSTMDVYLSPSIDGNDFTKVKSITGTTALESERIPVPLTGFQLEKTVRIKLQGTGFARIREITYQTRQLPIY